MFIWRAARFSAKLVAATLVLLLAIASQAPAATITATFTGTVKTGLDSTGVFGTPGANLAGAGYNLVFTADPTVGNYFAFNGTITDPLLSGDNIFGGMSAVLTVNGHSYNFLGLGSPGGTYDIAATKPGTGHLMYQVVNASAISQVNTFLTTNNPPGFPTSVFTAVALNSCPAASCSFYGSFIIPTPSTGYFQGTLNFGSLSVAVAMTPIPATLPLLVSALGGLGFVGWRRRQAEAA
ncbi:hypothetical protein [Dongia sp.]|uniref:hypothetical protein n=1 Tax=Dongia sp. TaxID=1977262 RepID=UPI003753700B